jgi:hypothetical protein
MSQPPAEPASPELTPHLVVRPSPLPPSMDSSVLGFGDRQTDPGSWGVWSAGDRPMLAKADWGLTSLWQHDALAGGFWHPLTNYERQSDQHGNAHNVGDRGHWGAWGQLNGRQVLAVGGRPAGLGNVMPTTTGNWSVQRNGLWLLRPDEDQLDPFETGLIGLPLWGVWGQINGEAVLATGGEDGWVRLWDPLTMIERGALQATEDGWTESWGAWGQQGEPLVTGDREVVQVWPAEVLEDPAAAASQGGGPRVLFDDATRWGAWGQVDGTPILALGNDTETVSFLDPRTETLETVELAGGQFAGSGEWGAWAEFNGRPVLTVGNGNGTVWLCNFDTRSIQHTALDRTVRWSAWVDLDGLPVLAVADGDGTVGLFDLYWERVVPRVPRYRSDTAGEDDRLGRRHDAAALADVITARSARPPLAVGVFGQWGDGKSMFLEMVQELVRERSIAAGPNDPIAHGAVRQARFNAWHYAEADLWASLVAELFTQLNSDSPGADPAREQRQRSRLASELVQARGLREQLAAANERLTDLRKASAKPMVDWNLLPPSTQRELRYVLGGDVASTYQWSGTAPPLRLARQSVTSLARAIPRRIWLITAAAILAVVALVIWGPGFARWFAALPPIAVIVLAGGAIKKAWERTQPIRESIRSGWKGVRRALEEQKRRLETAEAVAIAEVEELQARLQNLTSAGQLAGVVQERAGAASYRERLGLMTQIRQDFERMADLLHPDEAGRADVPVTDAAGDELPAIDRIVVYIDDLDRCPPDRVVEVLEAIHLLLAVRLFVVVVAVDPRWLLRSLTSHYHELFAATGPLSDTGEDELWASTPAQYLEKIFQIVLTLPPMEQTGYRDLIGDLVGLPEQTVAAQSAATEQTIAQGLIDPDPIPSATAGASVPASTEQPPPPVDLTSHIVDRVDPLALTSAEFELIQLLGPPLITGPRSVKRLANSYGLLIAIRTPANPSFRGRPDLDPVPDLTGNTPPYRAGMVLLATVIGFPMLGPFLFPDLHHTAKKGQGTSWQDYLDDLRPADGAVGNRLEPAMTVPRRQQWIALLDALKIVAERAATAGQPLPQDLAIWSQWVVPVGRLSFPTGGAVSRLIES